MDISIQIITWELPVISVLQKVLPSWAHRPCTAQSQPQSHRLVWGLSLVSALCVCCGDGGILFEMLTADGCVINWATKGELFLFHFLCLVRQRPQATKGREGWVISGSLPSDMVPGNLLAHPMVMWVQKEGKQSFRQLRDVTSFCWAVTDVSL